MRLRIERRLSAALSLTGALALPLAAAASDDGKSVGEKASEAAEKTGEAAAAAGDKVADTVSDAWLTAKVKSALFTTEGAPAIGVNVDTMDRRVTLHGIVETEAEKAIAERTARGVEGVASVRNLLYVEQTLDRKAADARQPAADADLRTRVEAALQNDRRLARSSVRVESVKGGNVVLAGTAPSMSEHGAAIRTARSVPGVRRVSSTIQSPDRLAEDEIRYEGEYDSARYAASASSDAWITTTAKMRLLASRETPGLDINVDTTDGVVTLFGIVDSETGKSAATNEVRKVAGVRDVRNVLQVVPESRKDAVEAKDGEVQAAVERRLDERTDLRGSSIDVEVSKGIARLTGTVDSANDHLVALSVARATPGVRGLIDDLRRRAPDVSSR